MAAGFNLDKTCDVGYCDDITIGPQSEVVLGCRWNFDSRHWQRMSFAPVGRGRVTIVDEWVECEVHTDKWGTRTDVILWTRLSNKDDQVITVTPTVVVAPTRYRR